MVLYGSVGGNGRFWPVAGCPLGFERFFGNVSVAATHRFHPDGVLPALRVAFYSYVDELLGWSAAAAFVAPAAPPASSRQSAPPSSLCPRITHIGGPVARGARANAPPAAPRPRHRSTCPPRASGRDLKSLQRTLTTFKGEHVSFANT